MPHDHEHQPHDPRRARHEHGASGHVHSPANFGKAFAIGVALNGAFVVLEVVFGVASHSVALLAVQGGDKPGHWSAGELLARAE